MTMIINLIKANNLFRVNFKRRRSKEQSTEIQSGFVWYDQRVSSSLLIYLISYHWFGTILEHFWHRFKERHVLEDDPCAVQKEYQRGTDMKFHKLTKILRGFRLCFAAIVEGLSGRIQRISLTGSLGQVLADPQSSTGLKHQQQIGSNHFKGSLCDSSPILRLFQRPHRIDCGSPSSSASRASYQNSTDTEPSQPNETINRRWRIPGHQRP